MSWRELPNFWLALMAHLFLIFGTKVLLAFRTRSFAVFEPGIEVRFEKPMKLLSTWFPLPQAQSTSLQIAFKVEIEGRQISMPVAIMSMDDVAMP